MEIIYENIVIVAVLFTVGSYFLGNISPASIMGHIYGVNIRKEGSGNPGTTNVLRTLGVKAAFVTLTIDITKGILPVIIGKVLGIEVLEYIFGTAAFIGHIYPLLYGFKGGKGIATGFGIIIAIDHRCGLVCLLCAILGALLTKRMSCGSIAAGIALPVTFFFFIGIKSAAWAAVMGIIVIWRHKENIKRLLKGYEPEIDFLTKKSDKDKENE